ncbi:tRNA (adenosine(37)-N6)-dimethylallyltransferase MiaA [Patescibacteria group bacterium]|nr:tRNA (adenosine(37)-N6)-dimethylallyltransferase MiaA [Patescibacteria group bacterium]
MKSQIKNKTLQQNSGQVIIILGPTASGKSELAVKIARKIGGEIISADSRQIYKNMKIGTGLITKKEMRGIKHYCINYISPKKRYTVINFKKCAEKALKDILKRGKIPIICGGTGFYISALTGSINIPEIKPNWQLRKKLEKMRTEKLFNMLKKLNPERAQKIDPKNPRRLIRAIEIAKSSSPPTRRVGETDPTGRFLQIGIKLPEKELKKRIEKRIKNMVNPPTGRGLINEVKKLKNPTADGGLSWKRLYELGFEYKYPAMFLQGKISKQEMTKRMILKNLQYAKRQMTWFKKYQPETKWIKNYSEIKKLL